LLYDTSAAKLWLLQDRKLDGRQLVVPK